MEGYLWKKRFYLRGEKQGVLRQRFVVLNLDKEVLEFKTKKEEKKVHKRVPLEEISDVVEYGDHGFIVAMRYVATHETCGAAFLFEVGVEVTEEEMTQSDVRDKWVEALKGKVNSANNGLDLVMRNIESIHHRYEILYKSPRSLLGHGMSGDVRLIYRKLDKKAFAMKTISLSKATPARLGGLRREIDILKSLDHPHIARLHEVFMEPKLYCRLIIELCNGGEMLKRLNMRGRSSFGERYAGKLITTMLKALNYLHINNIVHRDLKLENWMFRNAPDFAPCENAVGGKKTPNCSCAVCEDADIALIDFGLSRRIRAKDEVMVKQLGTCYYVAPEVLRGEYSGCSCDMWSLGVISFMLISGKAPFDGKTDEDIANSVLKAVIPDIEHPKDKTSCWHNVSNSCKDFLQCLLKQEPSERLTAGQALEHPWISQFLHGSSDDSFASYGTHKVADSVLERLRNFSKYKELKRLAMEVIAFTLDHKDVKDLTDLFEEIDTDNDGYITLLELVNALQDYDNVDKLEIEKIFNALDEEQSGRVHVNEFVAGALQARYHLDEVFLQEAFFRLDVGQKGKVTLDDIMRVLGRCGTKERIQLIWEQSGLGEASSTGELDFNKFLEFMRSDGEDKLRTFTLKSCGQQSEQISEVEALKQRLDNKKKANPGALNTNKSSGSGAASKGALMKAMLSPVGRVRRIFYKRENSRYTCNTVTTGTATTDFSSDGELSESSSDSI